MADELIKKAFKKVNYTKQQIEELKQCMHPVTGPMYFMSTFMKIQHPTKGELSFEPFDYQYDLIDSYHNYKYSISMIGRQLGKALSLDTPILTPDGFSDVGSLRVGDKIYGPDGKTTDVTYITETMNDRECYEIEFAHGEKIIADAEHLWTVSLPGHKQDKTITTTDLLKRNKTLKKNGKALYISATKPLNFEEKDLIVEPYYLGLWLGDGGTNDKRITCTIDDYQEYKDILENKGHTVSHFTMDSRSDKTGTFYIAGKNDLKELGVWGNKHIPDEYIFNSTEVRLELLRGLMDSDGSCDGKGHEFYQSNEPFIDRVSLLLSTLGIKSTKKMKETGFKDAFTLRFCTNKYNLFRLERKQLRQNTIHGHQKNERIYIKDYKKIDSVPVRCLQVNNDSHLFLCGKSLIPTHNTTVAAGYLLWFAMFNEDKQILIAAHKYDGALEIMDRVRFAYEGLPDHIRAGVRDYNKKSIRFDNGSVIESQTTTSNTGRGKSLSLIYLDEFAFVEPRIAKEFWTSISPTLSTGGKCMITSTPNTDEDQFAKIWFESLKNTDEYGNKIREVGRNGFKPFHATWESHPDRDEEWAAAERSKIGDDRFSREHCCLAQNSTVTLQNQETGEIFETTIGEFYKSL